MVNKLIISSITRFLDSSTSIDKSANPSSLACEIVERIYVFIILICKMNALLRRLSLVKQETKHMV